MTSTEARAFAADAHAPCGSPVAPLTGPSSPLATAPAAVVVEAAVVVGAAAPPVVVDDAAIAPAVVVVPLAGLAPLPLPSSPHAAINVAAAGSVMPSITRR